MDLLKHVYRTATQMLWEPPPQPRAFHLVGATSATVSTKGITAPDEPCLVSVKVGGVWVRVVVSVTSAKYPAGDAQYVVPGGNCLPVRGNIGLP